MRFFKYHALGNDYLVMNPADYPGWPAPTPEQIRVICHRNFGAGSDGILWGPLRATQAQFGLRIFNPDGSEAEKSGNGLRIFSRYLFDQKLVGSEPFTIEVPGGVVESRVAEGGQRIAVDMGRVTFQSDRIPVAGPVREVLGEKFTIQGREFTFNAAGIGNPVVYVGSKTGRDGIHGATMASAEFDDDSDEKRPTVQVGDPFAEKLLIEATLELMATGAVAAIQDMGAAGLTSSSVEMAGKGGVGIELDLDAVPQRETGMSAYEMMLSESQERMLAILKPGREMDGHAIFEKWGLDAAIIGLTTDTGHLVLKHKGETVCDVPLAPLFDDAPLYDRPWTAPALQPRLSPADVPAPGDYAEAIIKLMSAPDMASKRWLWEQYDRHVMADTLEDSATGADAGIVRVHGTRKALAVTSDCTPRYVQNDPYEGGKQAVAEAWRNLTAVGSDPIAITDNLNFGNPERPEIMGQIVRAIDGMAEACRVLDFPVVSGNVSLYNETNGAAIPPTPTVGGVGILADSRKRAAFSHMKAGDDKKADAKMEKKDAKADAKAAKKDEKKA